MANPITLAEVQSHLRLGTLDAAEQAELTIMITAATEMAESYCNRSWRSGTKALQFTSFPLSELKPISVTDDVQSITSIGYYDASHVAATFTDYRIVNIGGRSDIYPSFGSYWPSDSNELPHNITVTAVVGDELTVPSSVKSAILLMVADLYENRENDVVGIGVVVNKLTSMTSKNLLHPYKTRIA